MAGLLKGLEKLGLKNLDNLNLYEEEKEKEQEVKREEVKVKEEEVPQDKEKDYLFSKTYDCPVCGEKFKDITVKANRARLVHMDRDLRPVHDEIEPLKYEAIVCPKCGYAALGRYFGTLAPSQAKAIRENISSSYHGNTEEKETYTLEEALERNKMCLLNAIVKHAKASEKAYICLKCGWLVRCMREELLKQAPEDTERLKELKEQELEYLKNAYEGFVNARMTESSYPMCGMDEMTVDYLVAALAMDIGQYDVATKMIAAILTSTSATPRIKDKARDMKDELIALIREKTAK